MEKTDKDIVTTALREAAEETGIDPGKAEITGVLTPLYIPVSNIIVTPVVAWMETRPAFKPEKNEVVFIIEAGLPPFMDYSILRTKPFEIRGEVFNIKYFDYKGHVIWGATAMILHELLTVIKRTGLPLTV
jgi:8-oxo-dGTP pyrophosphatase MutT (NUDIX family)